MKILNTWKSNAIEKHYFELEKLIYSNGDWHIYKQFDNSFVYTFKNIAVNNLTGINKEHINRLATNQEPIEKSTDHFVYHRALETLKKGIYLIK